MACYFLAWLITSGVSTGTPRWFVFLTHWCFMLYNAYLIVAALSVTTKFLTVHCFCRGDESYDRLRKDAFLFEKPSGCCGYSDNKLSWYQVIHWVLFLYGNELAFAVLICYWTLLYTEGTEVDGVNANVHLVNGLVALIDLWVTAVPVNFLHFLYPIIFGVIYSLFSGIYFAITKDIIYERVLDYGEHLALAVGSVIGVVLLLLPGVHVIVFYLQYLGKYWFLYWFFNRKEEAANASVTDSELQRSDVGQKTPLHSGVDPTSYSEFRDNSQPAAGVI